MEFHFKANIRRSSERDMDGKRRRPWEPNDGTEGGADKRPSKRPRHSSNSSRSNSIPADKLQHLMSFFVEERREAATKAATARDMTIPRLMEKLVSLRSRLDGEMRAFMDEIAGTMEALIVCMYDLMQWFTLASPSMAAAAEGDTGLCIQRMSVYATGIEVRCLKSLDKILEHHVARDVLTEETLQKQLQLQSDEDGLQNILETFERNSAWEWKIVADGLVADCETLVSFINKNRQFLEGTEKQVDDTRNMYR